MKARDEFAKSSAPKNYYAFERDFKSLKADEAKLVAFLRAISAADIKNIFKSDMEPDILLKILKTYSAQPEAFLSENADYLVDMAAAIGSVSPFDLACDFMMDDEKAVLRDFVCKLEAVAGNRVGPVKKRFAAACQMEF